ncbi:peptide/nickel transport system permease protein [Burkholderia sp. D7]|uniref:Binding-protein-dependent transport system inner membrane protein n=1 Tax=Caballeronia udeis TaxID=1232866 RepID=A0A158HHB0_9BURK|nr:ABC transporter permease [Caballeronia udeis]SAL43507.1 binding-protein-dependent transport system inner membrane protein [Caballeronia udeis]SOE46508.1 peptide/nickel transport system permease protein [Burkholderia sp. D7]
MLRLISTVLSRRLIAAIPTLLMLSLIVFVVLRLIPADPLAMMLPPNATPADAALLRHQLGLDKPIPSQFLIWLVNALHGNLGASISFQQPVATLIGSTLPATLELCLTALVISLIISVPGGVFAYAVTDRRGELPVSFGVVLMQSVPSFLWALLLIALLGVYLPVLPFSGRVGDGIPMPHLTGFLLIDFLVKGEFSDWLSAVSHLVLPSLALAFGFAPLVIRVLRSSLLDQRNESYVGVARLRGVSESRILWRHMLKNAALPALTMIGVQFGFLFGGALLVEMIFSFPGVGNLMVQAVRNNDLVLIQGIAIVFCALMLVINAIVDTLYVIMNPRLRKTA